MTTITDEELKTILELSKKPELNLKDCSHSFYYYGVNHSKEEWSEEKKKDIETINTIMKKVLSCFVSFSNFTGQAPNRLRCQIYYDDSKSFIGVHYVHLEELIEDHNKEKEELKNDT